jgi:hypothetical protein
MQAWHQLVKSEAVICGYHYYTLTIYDKLERRYVSDFLVYF